MGNDLLNDPMQEVVHCRNPDLARLRTEKRKDLIAATARELEKLPPWLRAES